MFIFLIYIYGNQNQWRDVYNISVLRATFNLLQRPDLGVEQDRVVSDSFCKVAEALEALQKYSEAAEMYTTSTGFVENNIVEKGTALHRAGLAFRRANEWKKCEAANLQSLPFLLDGVTASTFDPNVTAISATSINLNSLYWSWHRSRFIVASEDLRTSPEVFLAQSLKALLYVAGWKAEGDNEYIIEGKEMYCRGLLKRKFTETEARAFLYDSFATGDVEKFRMKLLGVTNMKGAFAPKPMVGKGEGKSDKTAARDMLRPGSLEYRGRCFQCTKPVDRLKQCPCHTVLYCGKECQIAHWKAGHKNTCPTTRNKKK
ncbi:MAG: hypothetical protein SGARI_006350 [Bacillariaceae sp.]